MSWRDAVILATLVILVLHVFTNVVSRGFMAFEAYKVRRHFGWGGWEFAPQGECHCPCYADKGTSNCTGVTGSSCECKDTACHCQCGIPAGRYAGDIWFVEERGVVAKDMMLAHRYAVSDPSLEPADVLLQKEEYKRLLTPWQPKTSKR